MARLGRTGLEVSRLGVGAMTWGAPTGWARLHPAKTAYGGADSADEEVRALEASLAGGVTLFDTAAAYSSGAAEIRLGELARTHSFTIASKFPRALMSGRFKAMEFESELAGSLSRLGVTAIDLYQHHWPGRVDIPELMNRMADAVGAGKIRAIGVSNYSAAQMHVAAEALAKRGQVLASNQVQYSLLHRAPDADGVMEACRELGVTLVAYSPLAMGMLSGKYSAGEKATGLRRFMPQFNRGAREAAQPVVELLRRIASRHGKTPSQVALRWLIENPVVLPIPGAKNGRQAADNAGALSFALTGGEIAELDAASAGWKR
jgi:aryl-alcohol dehydrogenase-like predicted oxidoreductase